MRCSAIVCSLAPDGAARSVDGLEIQEVCENIMAATGGIVSGSVKPAMPRFVFGWVLCVLLALVFLMAGGVKLLSKPALVQEFH
jgi:hypothetical protein